MDIHWRVTTMFTDMNTWIYIGGLQQGRHEYMDIHLRVTTMFTDMNTWIYIGGLQQGLQRFTSET